MKELFLLTVSILISLQTMAGQKISLKPYNIKSGIIEYAYSGDRVGKGILYFDDYGLKSAMYTDAVEHGKKRRSWVVSFGDYQYIWDPDETNEGMKLKNPVMAWLTESSNGEFVSFTESMYVKMGFATAQDEVFLGKNCRAMTSKFGKILMWDGILMLLDMKVMGQVTKQEVTRIETNIPVEARYFFIPKNIKFSEMPMF